jgi:hypothetical protein
MIILYLLGAMATSSVVTYFFVQWCIRFFVDPSYSIEGPMQAVVLFFGTAIPVVITHAFKERRKHNQ